jgi:Co/Zn/Cd efflux system component
MRQRNLHNSVGSVGSVIVLAAIIAIFVTSWQIWAPLVALAIGVIVVGRTMGRNPAFEQIRAAQAEYRMTCQSYVVELRSAAS